MDITIAGKGEYNFYSAIVPKKMAEEVMATYAIHPGVQATGALRRWTMTPGEGGVEHYTILTAYVEGQGAANLATRKLRQTLGEFGMYRVMPWGWWQIEYENTGTRHGVEYQGHYAPMVSGDEPSKRLMQYLADKFSVGVYINGL
jgi:hypothetical protein